MKMEMFPNNQEIKKGQIEIDLGNLGKHTLEISSKNIFEYPDTIQKETGIKGYERTVISKEVLHKLHEVVGGNNGEKLTKEILNNLSEGEFFQLAVHQMGGYTSEKDREKYAQNFADQKFILQKIFDIEGIQNLQSKEMQSIFSHGSATENEIFFSLFNKKDLKVIESRISPKELPKYEQELKSGAIFACTTESALSDTNSAAPIRPNDVFRTPNFFHDKVSEKGRAHYGIESEFPATTVFAFDPREPHLHKYFVDMYNLYVDLNKVNHTNIVGDDEDALLNLYEKINYKNMSGISTDEYIEIMDKFFEDRNNDFQTDPQYIKKQRKLFLINSHEGGIPIIIGHDRIKQLRWGDSRYAVFFTEKGLNFLKIKHSTEHDNDENLDKKN